MQPTIYRLSELYVRKETRPAVAGPLALALVIVLATGPWGFAKSMHPAISILFGSLTFAYMFYENLKLSRQAAEKLPQIAIEVSPETIRFIDSGGMYEIPVSSIKAIAVDRRSDEPRIIYLQRHGEGTIKIDDLDRMRQFESQVSRIVGSNKVRDLKWWQGPPG